MDKKQKKEVVIELVNDISTLIRMQQLCLKELMKTGPNETVLDFQEDILRVLQAVNELDISHIDRN